MNWFILSLIAMLFWSGSDLFSKIGSKPNDKYSHWKMVITVGTIMGIHALYMIFIKGVEFNMSSIITYLPASALYILSMIFGYAGLRYIQLSISSPICNSSGAVAVILCFVFLGERMTILQTFAVLIICLSVFAISYIEKKKEDSIKENSNVKYEKSILAIVFPLLYCLIDGLGTFADALILDKYISAEQANIAYELTFLIMAIFAFIYTVIIKNQKIKIIKEKAKITAALSETTGQFFYIFAIEANAILAAPIISAYCILSLVWSRIFLKEKLNFKQYIVIAIAIIGIAILGME